jgi:small subunit ribosomal protein S9
MAKRVTATKTPAAQKRAAMKLAPQKQATQKPAAAVLGAEGKKTEAPIELDMKKSGYIATVGRRKTSIARVRLIKNGSGRIIVNGRSYETYFNTYEYRRRVEEPLEAVGQKGAVDISAKVIGGGMTGQAEAIRHGIARALVELNPTFRKSLKKLGFLSRDPRKKERKKPGLKKARRAKQWSKR